VPVKLRSQQFLNCPRSRVVKGGQEGCRSEPSSAFGGKNRTQEDRKEFEKLADRPNIVFVLMDNLGYGEPGCYGGGILRGAPTPRLDRLATEGMRLTNSNVEARCTPSRSAVEVEGK
jgi:Sulfatase